SEETLAEVAADEETTVESAPVEEAIFAVEDTTFDVTPVQDDVSGALEEEAAVVESSAVEAFETPEAAAPENVFESAASEELLVKDFEVREDEAETPTVEVEHVEAAALAEDEEVVAVDEPRASSESLFEEASGTNVLEEVPAAVEEVAGPQPADEFAPAFEAESHASGANETGLEAVREIEPSLPFADAVNEAGSMHARAEDDALHVESSTVEMSTVESEVSAVEPEPEAAETQAADAAPLFAREIEVFDESPARFVGKVEPSSAEVASADEWEELDMSEAEAAPHARSVEPVAPVFETSGGDEHPNAFVGAPSETRLEESPARESAITLPEQIETGSAEGHFAEPVAPFVAHEKGVEPFDEMSIVPASVQQQLLSSEPEERANAIMELSRLDTGEAFHQICVAFDDEAREVRSAAARALYNLREDRADSFTRALRESDIERRHQIGAAISASGLATEAIGQLTGESREKTYEAFSLLFLMAKAGEVMPLIRAIEGHPNNEVRLAVVKLLALSGQKEVLPAFRRLAVRGSLPTEVRSAVMEAIYQISSSTQPDPTHA
ncbi:MAG: hypothetical protein H0T60_19865, partial [Acidobacteria bacterium]|nr:hypothetical protein [Acidobacteriota bacterium]